MPPPTFERIRDALAAEVKHRVWIISDLQQSVPENAAYCLSVAVEDFRRLDTPCEQIWYLGDAVEGTDRAHLEAMADMQAELLGSLQTPLRFVLGNHDFDYSRRERPGRPPVMSFRDRVLATPGWKTADPIDRFFF